ncbi:hypothetical protein [Streptomyces neyagawaensis]|uniref:hypothetical protein n=1 Tax=Streptomyces neyagawaensis TaxID=42238 RepID=UPI003EB9D8D8
MELPVRLRQARSALLLIFLVHGAVFALLVTRIPAIQDRYGLSDGELPLALAAVPILAGVGTVTASRVVRRVPPHVVVRVVQPLICLALAGVGAGEAVWQLAVCLVAFGLLVGAMEASLNMTGVGIQRGYGRSIMLGFHGAASLGGILGAALSWAGAHWHLSLFTVFASSVVMLLPAAVAAGPASTRARTDRAPGAAVPPPPRPPPRPPPGRRDAAGRPARHPLEAAAAALPDHGRVRRRGLHRDQLEREVPGGHPAQLGGDGDRPVRPLHGGHPAGPRAR